MDLQQKLRLLDITYAKDTYTKVEDIEEELRAAVDLTVDPMLTENLELEKGIQERLLDFVVRNRYPVDTCRRVYLKRTDLGFDSANDHWLVACLYLRYLRKTGHELEARSICQSIRSDLIELIDVSNESLSFIDGELK